MDKNIQAECSKVLKRLNKNPDANPFKFPVDYKLLQIPDYPNIIKNPMDLGTIDNNLKAKKYKTSKEFFDDIYLIWNNCKTYNQDGSIIYEQATKMENNTNSEKEQFENIIKKLMNQGQTQQAASNPPTSAGIGAKQKKTDKSVSSSIIKKKISKNKEGSSSITVNTNTNMNSVVGSNNVSQPPAQSQTQYTKKERAPPPNKGEQQQDKYVNQQERKYAHISLRLNLAFKLKNATEDKLVNLFAMLAEKHPETLVNIENRDQKLQMNMTLLPDQTIQNMIAALEFKD